MGYLKDKIIFKIKRGGGYTCTAIISNLQMHKEILKLSCAVSNIDYKILINICTHNITWENYMHWRRGKR